jgi:hypothetical protein
MSNNELKETLKKLAITVKRIVDEHISEGTIQPQDETYFRWKVEKFQYADKGVADYSARGEYFTKKSWFRAIIKLEEIVKSSNEYSSTLEHLTHTFGISDKFSLYLDDFITALINHYLDAQKTKGNDVDSLITTFLKDLREEPVKCGAEIELQGIVLRPEKIETSFGITLRQTRVEDLEREIPVHGFMMGGLSPKPSAIMKIELLGRGPQEVQKRVEKAITILRLFKVGGVKWASYRMFSESITDIVGGRMTSGQQGPALETYMVEQEDLPKLKKFWKEMSDSLSESFFWTDTTADHLTIAYKRYSDALLENGLLERRIANAVMGLEALILKPGEIQELPYRLGIRISKLFALLGYNPHETKKIINDAYKVRNLFAHGGQLSYKAKKKLESKYTDARKLLLSILNYLRILIIVMMLSRKEKDELIDLVDDSLVDRKREEQLNGVISQAKEVPW